MAFSKESLRHLLKNLLYSSIHFILQLARNDLHWKLGEPKEVLNVSQDITLKIYIQKAGLLPYSPGPLLPAIKLLNISLSVNTHTLAAH